VSDTLTTTTTVVANTVASTSLLTVWLGPLVTAVVATVGWIVVARFNVTAQRKQLENQVVDRARMEIVDRIRETQNRLVPALCEVELIHSKLALGAKTVGGDWPRAETVNALVTSMDNTDWVKRLEEYEILFPGTVVVRKQMVRSQSAATALTAAIVNLATVAILTSPSAARVELIRSGVSDLADLLVGHLRLLDDLRIYLQNASLGPIVRREIPMIPPPDASRPHLLRRHDGALELSDPAWLDIIDRQVTSAQSLAPPPVT
jgi:hypothetical protein